MDQNTVESIVKEIQNLKKNQKFIINEVMTFRDCFKNSIKKIEKNTSEMFENWSERSACASAEVAIKLGIISLLLLSSSSCRLIKTP